MRKSLLSFPLAVLLLGPGGLRSVHADSPEDRKPLAVVAFAGAGELLDDVKCVARLSDNPSLAMGVDFVAMALSRGRNSESLAGVDKRRPWGAIAQAGDDGPDWYAFLPLTELDQLHQALKPLIEESEDLGNGLHKVVSKRFNVKGVLPIKVTIFVKQSGQWLLFSDKPEVLAQTPTDPGKLLDGLCRRYDLAVRLNVSGAPEEYRKEFLALLQRQGDELLKRLPGEDEQLYEIRREAAKRAFKALTNAVGDTEQVTLGWSLDRESATAALEVSVTAVNGTSLAKNLDALAHTKSKFNGFRMPTAALTMGECLQCQLATPDEWNHVFNVLREGACESLRVETVYEDLSEDAKEFAVGILDELEKTAATGRLDMGRAVILGSDGATYLSGRFVADGNRLEETLGQGVEKLCRKFPDIFDGALTANIDEVRGVRLHRISLDVREDIDGSDEMVRLVGDRLNIIVGIAPEAVYLSVGKDALETLKQAIERSAVQESLPVPPIEIVLSMSEVAEFVAEMGEPPQQAAATKALELLEQAGENDHVRLSVAAIDGGVRLRLELEEGLVRLLLSTAGM